MAPWLTATRNSSTQVTLNVTSNVWYPANHAFAKKSMRGELQIQNADGSWSRLGNPFSTYASGQRTVIARVGGYRNFRYAMYSAHTSWDKVSAVVTR